MITIQRIVYGTDFSELSSQALEYAVYLAQACSAELHCLHVVDDSYQYWLSVEVATVPAGPPMGELVAAARKQLDEFLAGNIPDQVRCVRAVISGRPFAQIISYTRQVEANLVVLGTHGRGGLSHMLMGSVAEKVVRKSPCPVLTVRHPKHEFKMP